MEKDTNMPYKKASPVMKNIARMVFFSTLRRNKILRQFREDKAALPYKLLIFRRMRSCVMPVIIALFVASCASDQYEGDDLSNRIGFDSQSVPQAAPRTAPDYYYRQNNQNAANPYGNYNSQTATPYQYQQPYPQQYYVAPPYVAAPYQVHPGGSSRFYSNPYAMQPPQYYPQYDSDQYYVPPIANSGVEPSQQFNKRSF